MFLMKRFHLLENHVEYWEDDQAKQRIITNYKAGKSDGLVTEWDENGNKELEENYKDGKLNGLKTIWDENGNNNAEGNYKDRKLNGRWTFHTMGSEWKCY